jgi:hypothetical protein
MTEPRPRIAPTLEAALSAADAAWLNAIGWSDAAVSPIETAQQAARYERIEAALNKAIAALSFAERGDSAEGRLAAALGAKLADWRDKADRDDDED